MHNTIYLNLSVQWYLASCLNTFKDSICTILWTPLWGAPKVSMHIYLSSKKYTVYRVHPNIQYQEKDFKVLLTKFLSTSEVLQSSCSPPHEHLHF